MASELRVNQITSITGVGTVTFDAGGVTFVGSPNLGNAAITSINSGPISGARNKIINGDMRLDQRNNGASVTPSDGQYTLDRYQSWLSQSSKFSVQRTATAPVGFTSSILITSLSALSVGANDEHGITQKIEGNNISDLNWGTVDAKPVTLSFWVRSSITGNFGGIVGNGSSLNRIYPFAYTINSANTWEYKIITITGETSGTWTINETWGMAVHFQFGVGSNRTGSPGSWINGNSSIRGVTNQTNLLATNGATWNMTGLQLESGTIATPFERRSYGQELALCQRYFETNYQPGYTAGFNFAETYPWNNSKAWGLNFNASDDAVTAQSMYWKVTKRSAPVVTLYSPNNGTAGQGYRYSATSGAGNFTMSVTQTTPDHALLTITLAATGSTTESYFMFTANSEL